MLDDDILREMIQLAKVTIIRRYCCCYQHCTCAVYSGRKRFCAVRTARVHHACKKESCIVGDHVIQVVLGCTWCGVQVERIVHTDLTGWGEENRRLLRIRCGYNLQRQSLSTSFAVKRETPLCPQSRRWDYRLRRPLGGPAWIIVFLEERVVERLACFRKDGDCGACPE